MAHVQDDFAEVLRENVAANLGAPVGAVSVTGGVSGTRSRTLLADYMAWVTQPGGKWQLATLALATAQRLLAPLNGSTWLQANLSTGTPSVSQVQSSSDQQFREEALLLCKQQLYARLFGSLSKPWLHGCLLTMLLLKVGCNCI